MYEVRRNGRLVAIIGSMLDAKPGWDFVGPDDAQLQWGLLMAPPGMVLKAHRHLPRVRIAEHETHEFIYVIRGTVEVSFYDNKEVFESRKLIDGDFMCMYGGAHGFKVGEQQNLIMLEVKNGPHVPVEQDKVRL